LTSGWLPQFDPVWQHQPFSREGFEKSVQIAVFDESRPAGWHGAGIATDSTAGPGIGIRPHSARSRKARSSLNWPRNSMADFSAPPPESRQV
jgi:hypothetical protein